jgi:5,10-methylene-tetrahydrofolate dehydrogenase/methenyl tetrahydrofolate cyclohydrolase
VGIKSLRIDLPEESSEDDVLKVVVMFNSDPSIHGVLVQFPLPKHICVANMVHGDWLKPGAVVMDVGSLY